jgi:hypothetical protein
MRMNIGIKVDNSYQNMKRSLDEKHIYYSVRKVFFCENLVGFNEMHLHEAILNLYTHVGIFSYLSIASLGGKQHLTEVVFSALVGFPL